MKTPFTPLPSSVAPLGVGLHDGIPSARYHADAIAETPSLSSGVLRTLLDRSIEHAALEHSRIGGAKREKTPSMGLGSIVHALLAGEASDLVVGEFDSFRSKAAQEWRATVESVGKLAVLERDLVDARPIVEAIRSKAGLGISNDPFAAHGRSEVTAVWQEGGAFGAWCRARYDRLVVDPDGYADIWDWKTTADISDRGIERAIAGMGYHIQAAWYLRGLSALLPKYSGRTSFVFVFAETSAPYHVRRVTLSPTFLEIGRRKVAQGLARWEQALAAGEFTAPAFETFEVEAPAYLDEDDQITISAEAA